MLERARRPSRSRTEPWLLISLYVVAIVIYAVMLTVTIPRLLAHSGGRRIPDLVPTGLEHAQAVDLLSALGEQGRRFYLTVQLPLDMVYPAAMGLALALSLRALARRSPWAARHRGPTVAATAVPLIGALCDWGENICTALMIRSFPQLPASLPRIGGMLSLGKSVFISLGILLLLIACALALRARPSARGRGGIRRTPPAA